MVTHMSLTEEQQKALTDYLLPINSVVQWGEKVKNFNKIFGPVNTNQKLEDVLNYKAVNGSKTSLQNAVDLKDKLFMKWVIESIGIIFPDKIERNIEQNKRLVDNTLLAAVEIEFDAGKITELIAKGADVNAKEDTNGNTPLHKAIKKENMKIIKKLIENGADVNAKEYTNGNTPLHNAVKEVNMVIVDELIKSQGILIDAKNRFDMTPLNYAIALEKNDIASQLIENKANLNIPDKDGNTPLHNAIKKGNMKIIKKLIENGADVNAKEDTNGNTPLHYAVGEGNQKIVDALIKGQGIIIDAKDSFDMTPLNYAIELEKNDIAGQLIEKGAGLNIPDKDGKTPLHNAIKKGHQKIVEKLINAAGVDINAKDSNGMTPLNYAIELEKNDIAGQLIEKGAGLNIPDKDGKTPLHNAIAIGQTDIASLLIEKKANLNIPDKDGKTPLHYAVEKGNQKIVEKLIENKADVNAKDNEGLTPLHLAVVEGHNDIANKLVAKLNDQQLADLMHESYENKDKSNPDQKLFAFIKSHNRFGEVLNIRDMQKKSSFSLLDKAIWNGNNNLASELLGNKAINYGVGESGLTYAPLNFLTVDSGPVVLTTLINEHSTNHKDSALSKLINGANKTQCDQFKTDIQSNKTLLSAENQLLLTGLVEQKYDHEKFNGKSDLHIAAIEGDMVAFHELTAGKDASFLYNPDKNGNTALHFAALNGNKLFAQALIDNGADINAQDKESQTPLHLAILAKHETMVDLLIKNNADLNIKDQDGFTPLYAAIYAQQSIIAIKLIEGDALKGLNAGEIKGVMFAAAQADMPFDVFKATNIKAPTTFPEQINSTDGKGLKIIDYAIYKGNKDLIKQLPSLGARVDEISLNCAFRKYDAEGYKKIANLATPDALMKHRKDLEGIPLEKLNEGSKQYHTAILKALDAVIKSKGGTAEEYNDSLNASWGKRPVAELQQGKLEVRGKKNQGDVEEWDVIVGKITDKSISDQQIVNYINQKDSKKFGGYVDTAGNTLLHYAAFMGRKELVEKLLPDCGYPAKANKANMSTNGQMSALQLAASQGHADVVDSLLKNNDIYKSINQWDNANRTALHWAIVGKDAPGVVNRDKKRIVEALIDAGADVNSRGKSYTARSPMELAYDYDPPLMKTLVEAGAEIPSTNRLNANFNPDPQHQATRDSLLEECKRIAQERKADQQRQAERDQDQDYYPQTNVSGGGKKDRRDNKYQTEEEREHWRNESKIDTKTMVAGILLLCLLSLFLGPGVLILGLMAGAAAYIGHKAYARSMAERPVRPEHDQDHVRGDQRQQEHQQNQSKSESQGGFVSHDELKKLKQEIFAAGFKASKDQKVDESSPVETPRNTPRRENVHERF